MSLDLGKEKAFCDECSSHLLENVGPDHIIVKYRAALDKIERLQADNNQLDHEAYVARNLASLAKGIVDKQDAIIQELDDAAKRGNDLVQDLMANCNALRSRAQKAEARIADLEAETENHLQWGISNATDAAKLRVLIEDLEGWLLEERSLAIQQNPNRTHEYSDAESIDLARQQLISEDKIRPDDKSAPPAEMPSCRMVLTKEQREALDAIRDLVTAETRSEYIDGAIDVFDALFSSAASVWKVTKERKTAIDWAIEALTEEGLDAFCEVGVLRAMLEETR